MNYPNAQTDSETMELLRSTADKSAVFSEVYNMYMDMLMNYGRCLTNDEELIKDCIHDVFVKLMDKSVTYRVKRIGSFLIISLRNRIYDSFRRQSCTPPVLIERIATLAGDQNTETAYLSEEAARNVHIQVSALMNVLTPRQREAFRLHFLEEKEYQEVCEIMHMNYHSIRNLIHRGMLKMRAEVSCHGWQREAI